MATIIIIINNALQCTIKTMDTIRFILEREKRKISNDIGTEGQPHYEKCGNQN